MIHHGKDTLFCKSSACLNKLLVYYPVSTKEIHANILDISSNMIRNMCCKKKRRLLFTFTDDLKLKAFVKIRIIVSVI